MQVWPVYCHEQTLGPYTRSCGSDSAVSCTFRYGGRKILRLFPEVVDILRCFEEVKEGTSRVFAPAFPDGVLGLNRPQVFPEATRVPVLVSYLSLFRTRVM